MIGKKKILLNLSAPIVMIAFTALFILLSMDSDKKREKTNTLNTFTKKYIREHRIELPFSNCTSFTVDEFIFAAAENSIYRINEEGSVTGIIKLPNYIQSLTSMGKNRIIAAAGSSLYIIDFAKNSSSLFTTLGNESIITSLKYTHNKVYAADAGQKIVYIFSIKGMLLQVLSFSEKHPLLLPSPNFDIGINEDESIWITNTGNHKIDLYSNSGEYIRSTGSADMNSFTGCCNPVKIELISGNRIVTWEKGLNRISIYTSEGKREASIFTNQLFSNSKELIDMEFYGNILYLLQDNAVFKLELL